MLLLWILTYSLALQNLFSVSRKLLSDPTLPTDQYNALWDFYNSTNGTFWDWKSSSSGIPWDFNGDNPNPCGSPSWQGVTCSCEESGCSLTVLELVSYNISGRLPQSIGAWVALEELMLGANFITGPIPTSISNWSSISIFYTNNNAMTGALIPELGSLSKLVIIDVTGNQFSSIADEVFDNMLLQEFYGTANLIRGTLPDTIGNLKHCTYFEISDNLLTGSLPLSIGNLVAMGTFNVRANKINGTIPESIGDMTALTVLYLELNQLEGSLPSSFYNLVNLNTVYMSWNQLSGTLSEDIGNLESLIGIYVEGNQFYGSLPSSLGSLKNLGSLTIVDNLFSQNLPTSLIYLPVLLELPLSRNSFTGIWPFSSSSSVAKLPELQINNNFFSGPINFTYSASGVPLFEVFLQDNCFSGSIPLLIEWDSIIQFQSSSNYFTGSIPSNFSLYLLDVFDASINYLTGTIPLAFFLINQCNNLYNLNISNNLLSGSLPDFPLDIYKIEQIILNNNFLTSTLPESLSSLEKLVFLALNSNSFTGSIPSGLFVLTQFRQLFLQYNSLTGNLNTILDYILPDSLSNLDLSNNQLTGSLSSSIFWNDKSKNLESFAVVANCLVGSIPNSICQLSNLTSLALDGLSTSSSCRDYFFADSLSSTFTSFYLKNGITGTIPECLFSMPRLQTLHLSGNGLSGSLTSSLNISNSLTDLSLSYNMLTGSIPSNFQENSWINLDLSYNKFTGKLSNSFTSIPVGGSLYLEVNRLSDTIPSQLVNVETLNVLDGNIFACSTTSLEEDNKELPSNDPSVNRYSCGSNTVNDLLYLWVSLCGVLLIIIIVAIRFSTSSSNSAAIERSEDGQKEDSERAEMPYSIQKSNNVFYSYFTQCQLWRSTFTNYCETHPVSHLKELQLLLIKMRRLFTSIAVISIVILMPVYSISSVLFFLL
jgi:Leucine-rich repeat (LRR) protein